MDASIVMGLGVTGMSCVRHLRALGEDVVVMDSRSAPPLACLIPLRQGESVGPRILRLPRLLE